MAVVVEDQSLARTRGKLGLIEFDHCLGADLENGARAGLSGRADLAEQLPAELELVGQKGVYAAHGYMAAEGFLAGSEDNAVIAGADAGYVKGLGECDAESAALAKGVIEDALVLAEDLAVRIKYGAGMGNGFLAEGVSVVALAGETQLHAVGLVGNIKSSCAGQAANLLFGELSKRQDEPAEAVGRDAVEKVALVSGVVIGANKAGMTVGLDEAGIVTGG